MTPLQAFLRRHQRIALDTNVFIYSLEKNPKYLGVAREVLQWVEEPGHMAVTSTITMTEILVKPYRMLDKEAFSRFYWLLATYPNLEWVPPDLEAADIAARFRAEYRLKMADALQAATAAQAGATGLITNDTDFERIPVFETLVLEKLL